MKIAFLVGGDEKKYTGPVKKGNCECKKDMRIKNNQSVSVRLGPKVCNTCRLAAEYNMKNFSFILQLTSAFISQQIANLFKHST